MEPLLTPKGSDGTQPTGRRPSARANAHKRRKPAAKTLSERRQCDGIEQRDRRKEKAEGTLRTKPESASKAHRISGQGHHQEGARDGMSERLRLKNKREIGDGPRKGKDQAESPELSQTHCHSEGHSKRAGSLMAPKESSGRGRSLTRRILQAQKTT